MPIPKRPRASRHAARSTVRAALGPAVFASVLLMAPAAHASDCACHSVKVMIIACEDVVTNPRYVKPYTGSGGGHLKSIQVNKTRV